MRKHFTYIFTKKTIVGFKAAIDRANRGLNPEYTELTEMLAEHPDYKVKEKIFKKKEGKKTYSNLTFDRMEDYIKARFADEDTLNAKLIEFEAVKTIAEVKGAKYPLTKKWFLNTYKEYKENDVSEQERAEKVKALAQEAMKKAIEALGGADALKETLAETKPETTQTAEKVA